MQISNEEKLAIDFTPRRLRYSVEEIELAFPVELFDTDDDISHVDKTRDDFAVIDIDMFVNDTEYRNQIIDQIYSVCVIPELAYKMKDFENIVWFYENMVVEYGIEYKVDGKVGAIAYQSVSMLDECDE